ncbi:MAG TPA: retropepsin-like aspartic protease [Blastocatellia bacterium]|nr:retropepsin-like aspartic protease [Blastocatellia bacterium]
MSFQLDFTIKYRYPPTSVGVTIPVAIVLDESVVDAEAKIDTGSEYCIFRRETAEELGLEVNDGVPLKFSSLSGTMTAYVHRVIIQFLDLAFEAMVLFVADYGLPRNLLGRVGWLEHLHLGLTEAENTLYLSSIYQPK